MKPEESQAAANRRWEGPARAVVRWALLFPGHASLWIRGEAWVGTLTIDAFAPLDGVSEIELDLHTAARAALKVQAISMHSGIQSRLATTIVFDGIGPAPLHSDWTPFELT